MRQTLPIHRFFTTILFLAVTTLTWAYDFAAGGIYYDKNTDGNSVTVTYKTTSDKGYSSSVVIPSTVTYDGKVYSVKSIGESAFEYCSGLTSVTIPESVTSIGDYAFFDCSGLTSVTIPNSVTSIGDYAFNETAWYNNQPDGLVYAGKVAYIYKGTMPSGTEIVIKEGTLGIADHAFSNCTGLTSVTIPESVTSIGDRAFSYCSGLTSVTIPKSVTSIGSGAFRSCDALEHVTIGNNVTGIEDETFENCYALSSITIGNSVTSIGKECFKNCRSLTSIIIPNSVTSIVNGCFSGTSLTSIIVEKNNPKYDSRNDCNAIIETESNTLIAGCQNTIIPNSVTSIGRSAFSGCSSLTSVTVPESITSIGTGAFAGCTGLTKAEFASIESLCKIKFEISSSNPLCYAEHLYINGKEVTDVVIPNSVTSINDYAFYNCSGLTSVTIPNSVTSIGSSAFQYCSGLTSVTIPESITSIGEDAFKGTAWYNNQPDGLVYAGKVAYKYKGTMPLGTEIVIKEGTLVIAGSAFWNCSDLTSITIPESVTSISQFAFSGCSGLKSVTIPNSVTNIGDYAFSYCSGLKSVTCHAQNVPSTDSDVFYGVPQSTATLYVPKESIDAYKSASPWKDFGTILPITPTAVESLTADEASDTDKDTAIYDLNGRRMQHKPARGFYIQGGKKYYGK